MLYHLSKQSETNAHRYFTLSKPVNDVRQEAVTGGAKDERESLAFRFFDGCEVSLQSLRSCFLTLKKLELIVT